MKKIRKDLRDYYTTDVTQLWMLEIFNFPRAPFLLMQTKSIKQHFMFVVYPVDIGLLENKNVFKVKFLVSPWLCDFETHKIRNRFDFIDWLMSNSPVLSVYSRVNSGNTMVKNVAQRSKFCLAACKTSVLSTVPSLWLQKAPF